MTPVARFEREYLAVNNISAARRVEQTRTLIRFEEFSSKPLTECGGAELRAYIAHLVSLGRHPSTISKLVTMLRTFYGWAFDVELIDGNTLMSIQRVKVPPGANSRVPRPYSRKELAAFWASLDTAFPFNPKYLKRWHEGTSRYMRIRRHAKRCQLEAIVRLALDCGLRRQEIRSVCEDDIHPDNRYVVVRQRARVQNDKDRFREVPYTDAAREAVGRWLDLRDDLAPDHDEMWLSLVTKRETNPLSEFMFERILLSVPPRGAWTFHRFRHTCGTEWLRTGQVTLEQVSRLLGHANITQTLGYAAIVKDDIHKAVDGAQGVFEKAVRGGDG